MHDYLRIRARTAVFVRDMLFILVLLGAVSGCANQQGKVYESHKPVTRTSWGEPARNATVILTWWAGGRVRDYCVSEPEVVMTDAAGVFEASCSLCVPDGWVYKPGYGIAPLLWMDKDELRLPLEKRLPSTVLLPLRRGSWERLHELRLLVTEEANYHNLNCKNNASDNIPSRQVMPVVLAMAREAQALAKTTADIRRAERMRYRVEAMSGNKGYPDPEANGREVLRAVQSRDAGRVSTALGPRASLEAVDMLGSTPLMIAVGNGDLEIVQLLLEHGADPNYTDTYAGNNALHTAVMMAIRYPGDAQRMDILRAVLRSDKTCSNVRDWRGYLAADDEYIVPERPHPGWQYTNVSVAPEEVRRREQIRELIRSRKQQAHCAQYEQPDDPDWESIVGVCWMRGPWCRPLRADNAREHAQPKNAK